MKIANQEFKIESRTEQFRVANISPIDMLAISTQIDFENFKMTKTLMQFCLENVEVKMAEKWLPVKTKDKEIYWPKDIVNDFIALNELFVWMMENVVTAVFQKSSELTDETM